MMTRCNLWVASVATVVATLSSQARAETATIGFTTYLREGPSIRYRAIDEVLSDQRVDVMSCADAWCRIAYSDASGYVAQGALVTPPSAQATTVGDSQNCFVNRIAGYHGGPDVTFCTSSTR